MVLRVRSSAWLLLVLAALTSAGVFASVPHQGLPLVAVMAALLPLQLAALFWVVQGAPTTAARRPPVLRPRASD